MSKLTVIIICIFESMYNKDQILTLLKAKKPELEKKYHLSELGLFGSYARGDNHEKSDIDIAVEINGAMGLDFIEMADEIESLFGIKTDVVPKRSINPGYLPFVEKDIIYV